jgi:hypothetical protein
MKLKDILARTIYGTRICLIDLATDETIADFTMEFDKALPREVMTREVMEAEPTDFCVNDNCLTIKFYKDED